MILQESFYQQDVITVSKELLGKILVHQSREGTTTGRIVETEAYRGPEDQAAHSSGGRRTARNEVMFGQKGVAYVYFIYGLYHCFNIIAGNVPGKPEAVLIRALEPMAGKEIMVKRRGQQVKLSNLTNGPSKMCIAMGISKGQNKIGLTTPPLCIKEAPLVPQEEIVETTRIGVDYSGEWKSKAWRFYIRDNRFVSIK